MGEKTKSLGGQAPYRPEESGQALSERTKAVSGQAVPMSKFAYVGDAEDLETWKLPIHDESHIRNAMARFNQTELPAKKKKEVARRIVRAAKAHGIDTSGFEEKYLNDAVHFAVLLNGPGRFIYQTGGKAFVEIPIALTGSWVKSGREFSITKKDLNDLVANFEKRRNQQVVIDYEHASEMPEIAHGGPIPAAGWIHSLRANGYLSALVEWTPEAEAMIRKGEYRFFSPAIDWGARDKETGEPQGATLTSGALTNHPFLEELPPIVLSEDWLVGLAHGESPGPHRPPLQGADISQAPFHADPSSQVSSAISCVDTGQVHQDGFLQNVGVKFEQGGKMASKVRLRKMADARGKRQIIGDDDSVLGEFDLDDLDLDDDEVAVLMQKIRAPEGIGQGMMTEVLSQLSELGPERIRAARRAVALSECLKEGAIDLDKAADLTDRGRIGMKDYRQVQKAQELVEKAIAEGKFAPADREYISRVALADAQKFEEWTKKKPRAVPMGPPLGASTAPENATPDQELSLRVAELMSEKNLSRQKALEELTRTEPDLVRRYRTAAGRIN